MFDFHTLSNRGKVICEECGSVWEDYTSPRKLHRDYTLNDWITAIANKDTRLGYWEWIAFKIEEAQEQADG